MRQDSDTVGSADGPGAPTWWEDPDLAAAVAEIEQFAGQSGWDAPPALFALVRTQELVRAEPGLAATLADAGVFTALGQESLPDGDLAAALAGIAWPDEVAGCVLVQEIVVLPPAPPPPDAGGDADGADDAGDDGAPDGSVASDASGAAVPGAAVGAPETAGDPSGEPVRTGEQAMARPDRREARLVAGVLRGSRGGACLLRLRPVTEDAEPEPPLRGGDLAPHLLLALHDTFTDD